MDVSPTSRALDKLRDRLPIPTGHWGRRFLLSILVGIVAGMAASGIEALIEFGTDSLVGRIMHVGNAGILRFHWGVLFLPAAGGLLAGLILYFTRSDAGLHGITQVTRSFHRAQGKLGLRLPIINVLGSVLTISAGGSAGAEGPIAALGASIGSSFGRWLPLTPQDRRVLLIAGCAAGIGAIFRCPLGGALFATSILYSDPEFEGDALVSSVVASVIGYSTFMFFWGSGEFLLPDAGTLRFDSPVHLLPYAILGPACGVISIFFYYCMTGMSQHVVPRVRLPLWLWPAVGGLLTGALACVLPQVMDGRYTFFQHALDGSLFATADAGPLFWAGLFAAIAIMKCLATACTVGSGMPGGVLGPSVAIGGATGGCVGMLSLLILPSVFDVSLRDALIPVGMGGVVAATMRTPLAAVIMVTEMTGSYGLIAPLMLVCVSSYLIGRRWSLNPEQVRSSAESPAHVADPIIHALESWTVEHVMEHEWPLTISPNTGLDELAQRIEPGTRPVFAVADGTELLGLVSVADICAIGAEFSSGLPGLLVASDVMTPANKLVTVRPREELYDALTLFGDTNHEVLPVYARGRAQWIGMLSRRRVVDRLRTHFETSRQAMLEEHSGLAAIGKDLQLQQLMLTIAPVKTDRVQRLFVPIDLIGKSLREADFRQRYGAAVIAIEHRDGTFDCPPDLDAPLQTAHRLLVIVDESAALPTPADPTA